MKAKSKVDLRYQTMFIILSAILGVLTHVTIAQVPIAIFAMTIFFVYWAFAIAIFLLIFVPFARINKKRNGVIIGMMMMFSSFFWTIMYWHVLKIEYSEYLFFKYENILSFLVIVILVTVYVTTLIVRYVRRESGKWNDQFESQRID